VHEQTPKENEWCQRRKKPDFYFMIKNSSGIILGIIPAFHRRVLFVLLVAGNVITEKKVGRVSKSQG
jgi:hypothetical protein